MIDDEDKKGYKKKNWVSKMFKRYKRKALRTHWGKKFVKSKE
jgi:hypothetical protein